MCITTHMKIFLKPEPILVHVFPNLRHHAAAIYFFHTKNFFRQLFDGSGHWNRREFQLSRNSYGNGWVWCSCNRGKQFSLWHYVLTLLDILHFFSLNPCIDRPVFIFLAYLYYCDLAHVKILPVHFIDWCWMTWSTCS